MTAAAERRVTDHDLRVALRGRFEFPEWRVEEEVTLAGRRLDMVAFNLWAARRYRVVGLELKVSRGDWLRELASFEKASEWYQVVDEFYVVTPAKLIKPDELPKGWGHIELCGSRLMNRVTPAKAEPGATLPREIVARFLGRDLRAARDAAYDAAAKERQALRAEILAQTQKEFDRTREYERAEAARMRAELDALHKAIGLSPQEWDKHSRAMRAAAVLAEFRYDGEKLKRALSRAADEIGAHHGRLRAALDSLNAPEPA